MYILEQVLMSPVVAWMRCVNCLKGHVSNDGVISPGAPMMDTPDELTGNARETWQEARICLQSGAFTSAALMCRKLLFHMAVEEGLDPKNEKGRAPGFAECMKHLEMKGAITSRHREWADDITDIGNQATHDLSPVSEEDAIAVATFTRQLIREVYELPAVRRSTVPAKTSE